MLQLLAHLREANRLVMELCRIAYVKTALLTLDLNVDFWFWCTEERRHVRSDGVTSINDEAFVT